jgi:hypothetical protein
MNISEYQKITNIFCMDLHMNYSDKMTNLTFIFLKFFASLASCFPFIYIKRALTGLEISEKYSQIASYLLK